MKVLITGASGFIGREIVGECLDSKFEAVKIVSQQSKNTFVKHEYGDNTESISVDITNYESLRNLEKLRNVDVFIHAAGLAHQFGDTKKEEFDRVNVLGTQNVSNLAVSLNVKQFILISSTAVYGSAEKTFGGSNIKKQGFFDENSEANPQTLYAKSKLESEKICIEICEKNKIPLTIFRLAPVIGEDNVGNVARLISAIDRKRFVWIGRGDNFKTLIYKKDVARACVKLIEEKRGETEIFNLSGEPIRMKDFVGEISQCLQRNIPPFTIPQVFTNFIFAFNQKTLKIRKIFKLQQTIEKWLADDVYVCDKIKQKYDFAPKFTVAEGVQKQVASYILQKNQQKNQQI